MLNSATIIRECPSLNEQMPFLRDLPKSTLEVDTLVPAALKIDLKPARMEALYQAAVRKHAIKGGITHTITRETKATGYIKSNNQTFNKLHFHVCLMWTRTKSMLVNIQQIWLWYRKYRIEH